jgi:hypothetical protein
MPSSAFGDIQDAILLGFNVTGLNQPNGIGIGRFAERAADGNYTCRQILLIVLVSTKPVGISTEIVGLFDRLTVRSAVAVNGDGGCGGRLNATAAA